MKNVEILISNAAYENGECVGGYHEIHKINYLQNAQHLIATYQLLYIPMHIYATKTFISLFLFIIPIIIDNK